MPTTLRNESRGNIDAPILNAIEAFLGTEYVAPNAPEGTERSDIIASFDTQNVVDTWQSFVSSIALRMFVQQNSLNENNQVQYDFATDQFSGDWTDIIDNLG